MPEATIPSKDANGYAYVETSPWWKECCAPLPSFSEVWWPDYATKVIEDVIDGQPVVIQLWKGWCQRFLGRNDFPGGIGAEVGIYRRIPGKAPPATLLGFPKKISDFILGGVSRVGDEHLWFPYPELNTKLTFELVNPKTGKVFFGAGPETTYWLNKWMHPESYEKYRDDVGKTPLFSVHYELNFTINGKPYSWKGA
jgi:hypothetical protein